ncbi:distal tail protein Dit, partial [Clostridium botulinum]
EGDKLISIDFNGYNSYKDFGLVMEKIHSIPTAEKIIKNINIEGVQEALTEDQGYKNTKIIISFGFKSDDPGIIRAIKSWLMNFKDNKLTFSNDTDIFYKVKDVKVSDIITKIRAIKRLQVQFTLDPFVYYHKGLDVIEIVNSTTLISPEFATNSMPIGTIYGSGDIVLNINNQKIYLRNVEEKITINSVLQECYKGTINCNNKMCGEFPQLDPGESNITWNGAINKIEITPNWRTI